MADISCYGDFVRELLRAGFSTGSGNPYGVFSLIPFTWEEQQYITAGPIRWHTEDPETDPWEWRMRVLQERHDIAYGKLFHRASGFITREWYPDFISLRRGGDTFEEAWEAGSVTHAMKRVYDVVRASGSISTPILKREAGFGKGENAVFEQALTDLQMRMFLTICGQEKRVNKFGQEYGWYCAKLCTVEQFWGGDFIESSLIIDPVEAEARLTKRILELNPEAKKNHIRKFLYG